MGRVVMEFVGLMVGLLTLGTVVAGVLGLVDLVVFRNWSGFWQWTFVSIGLAVVRYLVIVGFGRVLAKMPGREGDAFRRRLYPEDDEEPDDDEEPEGEWQR